MIDKNKIIQAAVTSSLLFVAGHVWSFGLFDTLSSGLSDAVTGVNSDDTEKADQTPPVQQTRVSTQLNGVARKNANIRSAPNKTGKKIGRIKQGSDVIITKTQGSWYQIASNTDTGFIEGWVYSPLITVKTAAIHDTKPQRTQNRSNVYYAGYSKEFQPIKRMMIQGNLKGVEEFFNQREEKVRAEAQSHYDLIQKIGLLRWMERGTLALDTNNLDKSIDGFENAETVIKVRQENSQAEDFLSSITSFAAETVTGNEEFQDYG